MGDFADMEMEQGLEHELDPYYGEDGLRFEEQFNSIFSGRYPLRSNRMPTVSKQSPTKLVKKKTGSVIDRISDVSFDDDQSMHILLYGKSGSGKTVLWSSFPGKILSIVCSGSKRSGELKSVSAVDRKKIKTVTLESTSEMQAIVDHVMESGEYKTVVLDHASGLQDLTLKEILGLEKLPEQASWGMATQQQYGTSTSMCKEIIRALLNLPINVVIIAQEREFGGGENGESDIQTPTTGAALTPSLAGWLYPACDFVCQTFIRPKMVENKTKIGDKVITSLVRGTGVEFCLRTAPHDRFVTKFRLPRGTFLPESLVNADYNAIASLIKGAAK